MGLLDQLLLEAWCKVSKELENKPYKLARRLRELCAPQRIDWPGVTIHEAAKQLGRDARTVYRWSDTGALRMRKEHVPGKRGKPSRFVWSNKAIDPQADDGRGPWEVWGSLWQVRSPRASSSRSSAPRGCATRRRTGGQRTTPGLAGSAGGTGCARGGRLLMGRRPGGMSPAGGCARSSGCRFRSGRSAMRSESARARHGGTCRSLSRAGATWPAPAVGGCGLTTTRPSRRRRGTGSCRR